MNVKVELISTWTKFLNLNNKQRLKSTQNELNIIYFIFFLVLVMNINLFICYLNEFMENGPFARTIDGIRVSLRVVTGILEKTVDLLFGVKIGL